MLPTNSVSSPLRIPPWSMSSTSIHPHRRRSHAAFWFTKRSNALSCSYTQSCPLFIASPCWMASFTIDDTTELRLFIRALCTTSIKHYDICKYHTLILKCCASPKPHMAFWWGQHDNSCYRGIFTIWWYRNGSKAGLILLLNSSSNRFQVLYAVRVRSCSFVIITRTASNTDLERALANIGAIWPSQLTSDQFCTARLFNFFLRKRKPSLPSTTAALFLSKRRCSSCGPNIILKRDSSRKKFPVLTAHLKSHDRDALKFNIASVAIPHSAALSEMHPTSAATTDIPWTKRKPSKWNKNNR